MEIEQIIKAKRKLRGITQAEMAEHLGVSRPSYIAVEQGKRELRLSELQKLEKLIGSITQKPIDNYPTIPQTIPQAILKTKEWESWYKHSQWNNLFDVDETAECGWMSDKHAEAFMEFIKTNHD